MDKRPEESKESKKRKRKSSPKYQRIKFFHKENSEEAKNAKKDLRPSHQLLVLGLPKDSTERALNDLMEELGKKVLGEDGIDIVQENIIGACQIDPPGEITMNVRITLDSRKTKTNIISAAEKSKRWGNGTHPIFFRDITLDQRKRKPSKSEDTEVTKRSGDTHVSRKDKHENTPRRGGDPKSKRLAPFGSESKKEEKSRTAQERQREQDNYERQRIQIRDEQLEARFSKREHQRREEEEEARKIANELSRAGPSAHNVSPIQQF